jgi:hypothetical protein
MIFQTIVHNTNAITKYADLDQCADETTYAHEGYGEPGNDLVLKKIIGKPGVSRAVPKLLSLVTFTTSVPEAAFTGTTSTKRLVRDRDPMKQSFS